MLYTKQTQVVATVLRQDKNSPSTQQESYFLYLELIILIQLKRYTQRVYQWRKMFFIMFPATNRFVIYWVTYLLITRSPDKSFTFIKFEAILIPLKSTEFNQTTRIFFRIGNQLFLLNIHNWNCLNRFPMLHYAQIIIIVITQIFQTVNIRMICRKVLKIT